jgi:hypothetical protein|tara:strand:- start:431 stop:562 length:132 start_codon:yes stop_codon:yes gene_type:complete
LQKEKKGVTMPGHYGKGKKMGAKKKKNGAKKKMTGRKTGGRRY